MPNYKIDKLKEALKQNVFNDIILQRKFDLTLSNSGLNHLEIHS